MKRLVVLQVAACLSCLGLALVLMYTAVRVEASEAVAHEVQAGLNVQANASAERNCAVAKAIRLVVKQASKVDPSVMDALDEFVETSCTVVLVEGVGAPPPTDTEQVPGNAPGNGGNGDGGTVNDPGGPSGGNGDPPAPTDPPDPPDSTNAPAPPDDPLPPVPTPTLPPLPTLPPPPPLPVP